MDRNAYFQLINENDKLYIRIFAKEGEGEKLDISEIIKYFEQKNIVEYDLIEINRALSSYDKETTVEIRNYKSYPIDEYMAVSISQDKMTAFVKFYPPSNDGKRIGLDEMKNDLRVAGVTFGVEDNILISQMANPEYCKQIKIASGKKPRQGKNAYIEYMFNTDRSIKPKRNEDGSVDFHQLNNISHIKKGDILAVLHHADRGDEGISVLNEVIKPMPVEEKVLKFGKNITISEDKLTLYSDVNGHATLEGDMVFVSNVYDVPADVDNSTGDIQYEGDVVVHGNVRTGFKIRAEGDVHVYGVVEGAEIYAGGNVFLHRGMQGMTRGVVVAKGNVVTKFIESSRVSCDGFVEADVIIQSQVSAGEEIVVNGPKGQIIGGHVRSMNCVDAKVIGSGMGITTIVEVGFDPKLQDEINEINENMKKYNSEYKRYTQVIEVLAKKFKEKKLTPDQTKEFISINNMQKELKNKIIEQQILLDEKLECIGKSADAHIFVRKNCFPGVQLIISKDFYNVQRDVGYCKFEKRDGKIAIISL